jgi:hypothetical protein
MEDSDVLITLRRIHHDFNLKRITFRINDLGPLLLLDTVSLKAIISSLLSVPFSAVSIWTKPTDVHIWEEDSRNKVSIMFDDSTKDKILSIKINNKDLEPTQYDLLTKDYFINLTETFYRNFD